jgi:hypothetical protein
MLIAGVAIALSIGLAQPPAPASASCEGTSCGVPECWDSSVRVRPDLTRAVTVPCHGVTGARLLTPPAHVDVTNVTGDWYGLHFDARPHDGAPRFDEAVFEIEGHEGRIEHRVRIEVVPTAENSPPTCDGAEATMRSDGTGPVDVGLNPYCRDPDGDEFVIRGGPPGVHPQSPKAVPAGSSDSNWHYRTATFSGSETTTIWATDVLGARSADAQLIVSVGPGVDREPECMPSSYGDRVFHPVYTRPGTTRRFALFCRDLDADLFTARLSSPPERGTLAMVEPSAPSNGYWGTERWYDTTYVPPDDSLEPDPFTLTASGARGDAPVSRMEMVPRLPPDNGGGSCGWSPANVTTSTAGILRVSCSDDDGDPLSVQIVTKPRHGKVTPAVVTPAPYGSNDITIPYVPEPGYEGYDCVEIRVTDGHGLVFNLAIDIWVKPLPVSLPVPVGELPELPPLPPIQLPGVGGVGGVGTPPTRGVVEQVLGTKEVKRVQSVKGTEVWARSKLSRKELARNGQAPALVVVCTARCQIRGYSELANGTKAIRASRRKTVATVLSGQPHVLALTLSPAEERSMKRARKPRAMFKLSVQTDGAKGTSVKRTIPIGS